MTAPETPEAIEITPDEETQYLLFTTKTCPNCKVAEVLLKNAGVEYTKIVAEENPDLAREYGIRQAPTLIAVCGDSAVRHASIAGIKDFLRARV